MSISQDINARMPFEEVREVALLQLEYSSANTPAMKRRGHLIRHAIPDRLRSYEGLFRERLGSFGDDLTIDASDGIGRKTEAPWVRLSSKRMSPTPRDGYYVVLHFSIDGTRMYVSVGCGSTIWEKGDLRPVTDAELQRRTQWAYEALKRHNLPLSTFTDRINLGAKAQLPRTFEKATICAKALDPLTVDVENVVEHICLALDLLTVIYNLQTQGADKSPTESIEQEIFQLARPNTSAASTAQGFGLTATERRLVEIHAMKLTKQYLESLGYQLADTSSGNPYDFLASKDRRRLKIEVKGTTSDQANSIIMTSNEVDLHRNELGDTGIVIVHSIRLEQRGTTSTTATGGKVEAYVPWDITEWDAKPIAFSVRKP